MKEALYYITLKNNKVKCNLCPFNCIIKPNHFGNCNARKNINGKLYSLVYGKPASVAIDPIEKKPLYHFYPGSYSLSIGTFGCNLHCLNCQNYDISQSKADKFLGKEIMPEKLVEIAIEKGCKSIAYTYNEPTIFYEYVIETAKLAKKKGLKNIMVTNGFINTKPLKRLYKFIDGANIDLKSIKDEFYRKICFARLQPVLEAIKEIKKIGSWIEITNLIIPEYNSKEDEIKELCLWIKNNIGVKVPLHFSAFYPTYRLLDAPRTTSEMLIKARDIARGLGIKYVYLGNTAIEDAGNTYCSHCGRLLIERGWFEVYKNKIKNNCCPFCGEIVDGVFE